MFEGEDIAFNGLEICSYRHLQGMAKNMGLPSNVKKVHLIEMIRAKKYCTETDLKAIVDRVKMERKVNAQAKKKKQKRKPFRLQDTEISSTSNSRSPPITLTPKRPSDFVIQYSPDITQTIMKYQPKPNILRTGTSILQPLKKHIESDRVLRSFHSVRRPNYRIMEQNDCVLGVVSAQNSVQEVRQERVQEIRQERAYQSVNVTIQKHRPLVNASVVLNMDRQLVPVVARSSNVPKPAQRQRKVSGIYPLQPPEKPYYEYLPTVGFRRTDGCVTKINAVIQKPLNSTLLPKNHANKIKNRAITAKNHTYVVKSPALVPKMTMTVQDMINYKVDRHSTISNSKDTSSLYTIDYQSNKPDEVRAIETRNYEDTEPLIILQKEPIHSTGNVQINPPRKVYKGCNKTKNCNYSIEYQQETGQKEWTVYDINGQLLDKTDSNTQNARNQSLMQETVPISNYKAKQRITEPISRDYQVEYQRFNEEIIERNRKNAIAQDARVHPSSSGKDMTDRACVEQKSREMPEGNVHARTNTDASTQYPNMASLADVFPTEEYSQEPIEMRENSNFSVYYHKKIRAEHIKKGRENEQLPRINDVFSQFNDVQYKSLSQPLYVHVSEESERVPPLPRPGNINTCMLESIYNFKRQFITTQPVLLIASALTHCTYSTKTVPTAIAQPAAAECYNNGDTYERANPYQVEHMPLLYDYLKPEYIPRADFGCDEVLSSSTASLETANSQELGANVTIPAMVEDALELISQDGDYMERIGMDVRVQCILCDWAGPKIILEYHIKKEHPTDILHQNSNEWSILLSLGELITRQTWYSQLVQRDDIVYVVSAKYVHTGVILVSLSTQNKPLCSSPNVCPWLELNPQPILLSLGELVTRHTWYSQLVQRDDIVYEISAKYVHTGVILVSLSMIPTEPEVVKRGRITAYNKITGKPFSREDDIKHIPDSMPYEYGLECLALDIGKLDLIPVSSLRVFKEFGEQSVLNNVEIVVYVKLID